MSTRLLFTIVFLSSILANAHGENKLGPHGGYIRMPGAFHTEVVPIGPHRLRVFLLDINWQNPLTNGSSVKARLDGPQKAEAKCTVKNNFYLCSFPKGTNLSIGKLIIETKRDNQTGHPVSYDLPFRLEN